MTTESSILSKGWRGSEHEIVGEIMKTDVFVKVLSEEMSEARMRADIDEAFRMFREFEARFSRFLPESELSRFNDSEEMVVSPELFSLLETAIRYHRETDGIFDPSILPMLVAEGYGSGFRTDEFGRPGAIPAVTRAFGELSLDPATRTARKPIGLKIDLGGIGKGYIVDRAAEFLRRKYPDCFVCAGGDIFAAGKNREAGYAYWAVDADNPLGQGEPVATLLLSDQAVATSGTDRRRWSVSGGERHHLIDPRTGRSAETDLLSATVVGETVERAEVFSKTLVILGREEAEKFAASRGIPAILVTREGETVYNEFIHPYVWKQ